MDSWTAFAHTGDPNHPGLPDWPAYEPKQRATLFFDLHARVEHLPLDEIRSAWMGITDATIFRQVVRQTKK